MSIPKPYNSLIYRVSWLREGEPYTFTKFYRDPDAAAQRIASLRAQGIEPKVWRTSTRWQEVAL